MRNHLAAACCFLLLASTVSSQSCLHPLGVSDVPAPVPVGCNEIGTGTPVPFLTLRTPLFQSQYSEFVWRHSSPPIATNGPVTACVFWSIGGPLQPVVLPGTMGLGCITLILQPQGVDIHLLTSIPPCEDIPAFGLPPATFFAPSTLPAGLSIWAQAVYTDTGTGELAVSQVIEIVVQI